jgi:hypothetical protein
LKTLSKTKGVGTKKDKADYLRREHMSDAELNRKVVRLKAKQGLHKAVKESSREQREFGEKVVQVASSVGVKYALNRGTITPKDLFNEAVSAAKTPKDSYNKSKDELLKTIPEGNQRDLLKRVIEKVEPKSKDK